MPGLSLILTIVLSLLGLAVAFFYMKKVNAVPLTLGLFGLLHFAVARKG